MQKHFLTAGVVIVFTAALVACGGGGGGGGTVTPPTSTPTGTASPTPGQSTTNASGALVDDATGAPLAGVKVGLAPWTAGATPMPEGTTGPNGAFSFTAPNGHYLLVIGSNAPGGTTQATIHDNVTLNGGTQVLKAPTLPAYLGVTVPAWETNGDYRLATLNATTEVPCVQAFNSLRTTKGVSQIVVDEWLVENTRAINAWIGAGAQTPAPAHNGVLTTYDGQETDGTCASMVSNTASVPQALSPNALWYAGNYTTETPPGVQTTAFGIEEFPLDPRFQADPTVTTWP